MIGGGRSFFYWTWIGADPPFRSLGLDVEVEMIWSSVVVVT